MAPERTPGVLADAQIRQMIADGAIAAASPILNDQIQPASLDLRLGERAYRVRASFLPGLGRTVAERLDDLTMHEVPLTGGAVLEKGCVYVVPLMERLSLPQGMTAAASAKSSIGRLDMMTRVITDQASSLTGCQMAMTAHFMPRSARRVFPWWRNPASC